jgi:hypothetical protein
MARRFLPVAERVARTPTVDAMRTRLGGRARSEPGIGRLVYVERSAHGATGVVLFVAADHCDVWIGENRVLRVRGATPPPLEGAPDAAMIAVAADAEHFAAMEEGSFVTYSTPGQSDRDGTLVEKCRYGALVLRPDGGIVGVGFRALRSRAAN